MAEIEGGSIDPPPGHLLKYFEVGLARVNPCQLLFVNVQYFFYQLVLKNPIQREFVTLYETFQDAHHIILPIGGSCYDIPQTEIFMNDLHVLNY